MPFTEINKIISERYSKQDLGKKVTASLVCEEFNKLIVSIWGKKIENNAQAMYLKDKILTIAALSPVVAQELKIREGELINRLADKFGQGVVDRLRLLT
ncbi:hypothetical protein COU24_00645 [Candidatus Kuenenbacteria bacterium CG10_big_fil_rev_8_21_14_0_10_39_14]|uniref:DUF721 domain-containing protein n=5 Tax=Candidatus Kueneniibacteriota TaxID=1752740 RepID=A0A2M7MFY6_9BACT|nr:DUF721 domain-containing protein [Candidatus Kuenenbacteria bacterium]OIP55597.1 MAG: hypothetical protein AUK13_02625 [Candidatus Kuenenbacteria bacterium CG2_30_39_24]PIP28788.1 MAG: hypothetical protein COX28_02825 [Candidatus Kuenenbacteria bacterium CG23_combo_of_CG06-09_8_20_14_all_39_39]PIR81058.1 MAG: hypothetical protein COU24_00645 [Candidatus Kuenenbacteria bacterium CG10_big_fil_rev_8_21_14_0_10_39_14]PIX92000.1 MAG: hypothetical protein COZ26_04175 [Candidatus Kuenenbacteria bac